MTGQLGRFLLVGFTTVAIDLGVYTLLLAVHLPVGPSKAVSFVCGTLFAYNANRMWTFRARGGTTVAVRFLATYLFALAVNVTANSLLLLALGGERAALGVAFVIATGLSATVNFAGMKFFAFAEPR